LNLPEVHNKKPSVPLSLEKVGVSGVKMPIGFVYFENKPTLVVPTFSAYINLPANQKGIHASRNYEIITEVLEEFAGKTYKLENACSEIAKELLKRHEYASRSVVKAVGEAMVEKTTPKSEMKTYEPCKLIALATARKNHEGNIITRKMVGVGIGGITACPCAQEMLKENFMQGLDEKSRKILEGFPWATHMQRSFGLIITEIPEGFKIDASKLVWIIEKSMSAPSYGLLKRIDEIELVDMAVKNPRFVEDCVRFMMKNFAESFQDFPDKVVVKFKQKSSETIHKHDFVAERVTTLGEIRGELKNLNL